MFCRWLNILWFQGDFSGFGQVLPGPAKIFMSSPIFTRIFLFRQECVRGILGIWIDIFWFRREFLKWVTIFIFRSRFFGIWQDFCEYGHHFLESVETFFGRSSSFRLPTRFLETCLALSRAAKYFQILIQFFGVWSASSRPEENF